MMHTDQMIETAMALVNELNMPQQKTVPTPTHQCKSCYKPAWHLNTDMDVCPSCGGDLKSFED